MKHIISRGLITATAVVGGLCSVYGQSSVNLKTVGTAVPFLRISPDAKAGGMGNVGLATTPDMGASFYNNAKTVFNKDTAGIGVTYTPWMRSSGFDDVYLASASGYYKPDDKQAISGSLRYFNIGNIQFVDMNGNKMGVQKPKEWAFDLGYARKLSEKVGVSVALRYISSNLASGQSVSGTTYKTGSAVAGDVSFFYTNIKSSGNGWNFGAALTNLGSKIYYSSSTTQKDYLPANLGIGVAYTKQLDEDNQLQLGVDLNKLLVPTPPADSNAKGWTDYYAKSVVSSWGSSFGDASGGLSEELKEVTIGTGLEYSYKKVLMVRAGYFYENKQKGDDSYFSAGVGLRYSGFVFNFSYLVPSGSGLNKNPLSNTLRFGLNYHF